VAKAKSSAKLKDVFELNPRIEMLADEQQPAVASVKPAEKPTKQASAI
jgi:hypothetical protein